jgi:hypothetical protein
MASNRIYIISYMSDIQFNDDDGELGGKVEINQVKREG